MRWRWTTLPPRTSLQWRLSLSLAAVVVILWLAAVLAAGLIVRSETGKVFDSALQEVAQRVLPLAYIELLNREQVAGSATTSQLVPAVDPHSETITYIVRDATGRVLMQSHNAVPEAFPADLRPGFQDAPGLRLYTESAIQGTVVVTMAEAVAQRQEAVFKAIVMLVWPLVLLLPLSILGVWILVARSMRPLLVWQREIEARGRGNLAAVNASDLPFEMTPIAASVDRLILRLRRALEAERSFTGNSAHELRTPIAAALAQTQRLLAETTDPPTAARARSIATALRDLSRLSEKLLQLAKAEGGSLQSETPQTLSEALRHVCSDLVMSQQSAARLIIHEPTSGDIMSPLDADAFAILAKNLIENALKHGDEDTPVEVSLTDSGVLRVANEGPIVPPDELNRLVRPFERGASRSKGVGLGLAIADAIAKGAGGTLELCSPIRGQPTGFEALVHLPTAPCRDRCTSA